MKEKNEVRMVWRWDDIFRVYRCPYCGRPEKPCIELWKKGGLKKSLPSRCTYCKGELEGVEGEEMIIEILELAAALEWIALGVLVYLKARSLSRRLDALCGKLPIGPGPDPKGARGAWGHCPKCGASDCEWDAETDVCTCKACGYTN